jgi:hypothetical protein
VVKTDGLTPLVRGRNANVSVELMMMKWHLQTPARHLLVGVDML